MTLRTVRPVPVRALLAVGLALVWPLTACSSARAAVKPPRIGERAPDFTLPRADSGQPVALSQLLAKHKAVVVMFVATRCPYSNGYNARMAELGKQYAARGIAVVGINSNKTEPAQEVSDHARKHGFTFPVLKDDRNQIADRYGATRTPEVFVLDPAGKVVYHGRIDEKYDDPAAVKSPDLRNALEAILAGKPVPRPTTKAFGCTIKRV